MTQTGERILYVMLRLNDQLITMPIHYGPPLRDFWNSGRETAIDLLVNETKKTRDLVMFIGMWI